jgi:hypothetical protein
MNDEGYVKYTARHSSAPPLKPEGWETLNDIRTSLHDLRLVGVYPDGIGFGNVSQRTAGKGLRLFQNFNFETPTLDLKGKSGPLTAFSKSLFKTNRVLKQAQFVISGTATGVKRVLAPNEYCLVTAIDIPGNRVWSRGPIQASSESMTHGAIYDACPGVNCVIHIHSRGIFDGMIRDKSPSTPPDVSNGTPEMARAVIACVRGRTEGMVVLTGHDQGIISYGPSPEKAFDFIRELYNKYAVV